MLVKDAPEAHTFACLVPSSRNSLGRIKRGGFAGGGVGFEISKIHVRPSFCLSLPPTCGLEVSSGLLL